MGMKKRSERRTNITDQRNNDRGRKHPAKKRRRKPSEEKKTNAREGDRARARCHRAGKKDQRCYKEKQNASGPRHRDMTPITSTAEEHEQNNNGTTTDRIVKLQAAEGRYEARLVGDNSNNFPIQRQMKLTRYGISKPPRMRRNIPMYYTTKKLQDRQVLKFNIRHPDPCRQLWNRRQEYSEHANQEFLIETMGQIREKEKQALEQHTEKGQ